MFFVILGNNKKVSKRAEKGSKWPKMVFLGKRAKKVEKGKKW